MDSMMVHFSLQECTNRIRGGMNRIGATRIIELFRPAQTRVKGLC